MGNFSAIMPTDESNLIEAIENCEDGLKPRLLAIRALKSSDPGVKKAFYSLYSEHDAGWKKLFVPYCLLCARLLSTDSDERIEAFPLLVGRGDAEADVIEMFLFSESDTEVQRRFISFCRTIEDEERTHLLGASCKNICEFINKNPGINESTLVFLLNILQLLPAKDGKEKALISATWTSAIRRISTIDSIKGIAPMEDACVDCDTIEVIANLPANKKGYYDTLLAVLNWMDRVSNPIPDEIAKKWTKSGQPDLLQAFAIRLANDHKVSADFECSFLLEYFDRLMEDLQTYNLLVQPEPSGAKTLLDEALLLYQNLPDEERANTFTKDKLCQMAQGSADKKHLVALLLCGRYDLAFPDIKTIGKSLYNSYSPRCHPETIEKFQTFLDSYFKTIFRRAYNTISPSDMSRIERKNRLVALAKSINDAINTARCLKWATRQEDASNYIIPLAYEATKEEKFSSDDANILYENVHEKDAILGLSNIDITWRVEESIRLLNDGTLSRRAIALLSDNYDDGTWNKLSDDVLSAISRDNEMLKLAASSVKNALLARPTMPKGALIGIIATTNNVSVFSAAIKRAQRDSVPGLSDAILEKIADQPRSALSLDMMGVVQDYLRSVIR